VKLESIEYEDDEVEKKHGREESPFIPALSTREFNIREGKGRRGVSFRNPQEGISPWSNTRAYEVSTLTTVHNNE
jgi:hypothetical protein